MCVCVVCVCVCACVCVCVCVCVCACVCVPNHLLPEFLYLVDDLPGHALIHHLLGGGHVQEDQQSPVGMGMVTRGEGLCHCI